MEQAERDLERAKLDVEHGFYEWACFTAQQSAEKAIKALERKVSVPESVERLAKLLDKYYIPTRYPNGFASGKPADYFTLDEAQEAVDAAGEILRFCKSNSYRKRRDP